MDIQIEEVLINHVTAVLAKEKGFDWPVEKAYFVDDGMMIKHHEGETWECNIDWNMDEDEPNGIAASVSLPTQSFLQQWLREVHYIQISIYCNGKDFSLKCGRSYAEKMEEVGRKHHTYEEALEVGLQHGLKSIKL